MGAPSYSSSNYDKAEQAYRQAMAKYLGETGYNTSYMQASRAAEQAGQTAGANAESSARSSGMTKAQAAATGASAAANTTLNAFGNAQSSALQNNVNTVNSYTPLLQGAATKDSNIYSSKQNQWAAPFGLFGGLLTGASQAMSDETKKDIKGKIDVNDRCDELISRLKGEAK